MGRKADALQQKSPAEFFADNRNIAGFDNPGKCLYTTVRELVENSLDAAEDAGKLPEIDITIEEISQKRLNSIRGISNHDRLDEELYQDHETDEAKKKRLAKEAKELEKLEKAMTKKGEGTAAVDAKRKEIEARRAAAASKATKTFYKITVKDNGTGMPHEDIPGLLGRVLSSTKYGVKQTRGKFGLGAKMALIWSKLSTGLPIEVWSACRKQAFVSYYKLDIDIHKNEPNIHAVRQDANLNHWQGSELSVTILGSWQYYRAKVIRYLRMIAVITPYAQFRFAYRAEDERNSVHFCFVRRTDKMPAPPTETQHHPASVDLELVKRLLAATKAPTLRAFLTREFCNISDVYARRLISEMQAGVDAGTSPRAVSASQATRLHQILHEAKFADPSGSHLSPAGEYNLRLGITKELHPDMVATYQGDARVLDGHAFVVEAAVSVGGRDIKPGINVNRFANRIPLLFEGGSDVITRTAAKRINWASYKINQATDRVGVFVSIVSTKIPYKGAGKEYISDDMEALVGAVKQAIMHCCLQLKSKIARKLVAREQQARRRNLARHVPDAAAAVFRVLRAMADDDEDEDGAMRPPGPKRARLVAAEDLLAPVRRGEVVEATLARKLTEHVERIDTDMGLEYQMQLGAAAGARVAAYLMPRLPQHGYGPPLASAACILRLLQAE
ncbi:hypothetical protein WJX81_004968 [Elliptochloris bilobata]|uniref:DNA topoisomerase 6 subunit B n=1 Tax=Elliptochloris bilobata TaxID=381761 RepID=A0AAW1S4Y8_9CHLO